MSFRVPCLLEMRRLQVREVLRSFRSSSLLVGASSCKLHYLAGGAANRKFQRGLLARNVFCRAKWNWHNARHNYCAPPLYNYLFKWFHFVLCCVFLACSWAARSFAQLSDDFHPESGALPLQTFKFVFTACFSSRDTLLTRQINWGELFNLKKLQFQTFCVALAASSRILLSSW